MSNNFNELQAAETFVQVVQMGNFAAVAKLKGENPSSVSRAVAQLEQHLGARLLNRTTRSVRITEAGETYLRYAQQMLEGQQQAKDALAQLTSGKPRGVVKISLPVVVGEHILANKLVEFHKAFPEVELQIDLSNRNVQMVEEGVDLALRFGHLADSSLKARKVSTIWRTVYASPAYLEKHGVPQTPCDLAKHQCIAFSQQGDPKEWEFWNKENGEHLKCRINSWVTCSSPIMVARGIAAGLGVGRSAEWMVNHSLKPGEVVPILQDWHCDDPTKGGLPMYLVFPPGPSGYVSPKTRVVADFLEQVIKKEFSVPKVY